MLQPDDSVLMSVIRIKKPWAQAHARATLAAQTFCFTPISDALKVGVPAAMEGCHSAEIEGYFLEGHGPPEAVGKLLSERPNIAGVAVPGMPLGSPGMGYDPKAKYEVFAVSRDLVLSSCDLLSLANRADPRARRLRPLGHRRNRKSSNQIAVVPLRPL